MLLVGVILWLDNAQAFLTGNGVFKAAELKPWIIDPASAPLHPSNYLFYPVYGALCRLLDGLGILTGDPRRQLTILNAGSAALCVSVIYRLGCALTHSRALAASATLSHLVCVRRQATKRESPLSTPGVDTSDADSIRVSRAIPRIQPHPPGWTPAGLQLDTGGT
jgi:hypothetical protein